MLQLQLRPTLERDIHVYILSRTLNFKAQMNQRSIGLNLNHCRGQAATANDGLTVDLQLIRPDIELGRPGHEIAILREIQRQIAKECFAALYVTLKHVDLAEKIGH